MRRKKTIRKHRMRETPDLTDLKKSLGSLAARYTEAQLCQLDRELSVGAALLMELYLANRQTRLSPTSVFDSPVDER
jgi:hypothetical protein